MKRRTASGFTLIEMVITVAIVALLAGAVLPSLRLAATRAREAELRADLRELRRAIDAYKRAWDEGRIAKSIGESGYPPTLEALVEGVKDRTSARGDKIYFLRRIPRDPFYPDASVPPAASWGKRSYRSPPDDPQEGDDVFDVYALSDATGLNGIPYRKW